MEKDAAARLAELLKPLIHAAPERWNAFTADDAVSFIDWITAFHVEAKTIDYLEKHPHASAQELWGLVPEGTPPGQEYLLDEILNDDD